MDNLTELYCHIDDFYQQFKPEFDAHLIATGRQRLRACQISVAEIMTILVLFHQLRYRQFKAFYYHHMLGMMKRAFPNLPSYSRFIELVPRSIIPLCSYLQSMMGDCTGISYIDSTKIAVCHNKRIYRHKVFKGLATRGKSSMGWFYGFKLHAIINHKGELVSVKVTAGNTDDRAPVKDMTTSLFGKLFGDRGYISKVKAKSLAAKGLKILTTSRKNMKNPPQYTEHEKGLLSKRGVIETVNDQLKNIHQIEHSRHRSVNNFMVNLMAAIVAYCLKPNKPTLKNLLMA